MVQPKTGNRNQDVTAILCFSIGIFFFLWRAKYGFGPDDESWYPSFSQRLMMGDSLITDEWNVAQFIGFLLYIPVKVYFAVVGSAEGITLFFRYLFVLFQGIVTAVAYWRLRHYGYFSILACAIFFLHVPWTIMALFYHTMALGFVMLTGVILASTKHFSRVGFYIIGLLFACAVLCNPPLALVYFLFSLFLIVYKNSSRIKRLFTNLPEYFFNAKSWIWITAGISTMATIFIFFIFSRTNLRDFLANFPSLFTDPEYNFSSSASIDSRVFTIFNTFNMFVTLNKPLFLFSLVSFLVLIVDKKRMTHRPYFLIVFSLINFFYIVFLAFSSDLWVYMYWTFPLVLPGLAAYILSEIKDRQIFIFLWLFGLLFASSSDISSAFGSYAACIGFSVMDVASVLMIRNVLKEMKNQKLFPYRKIKQAPRKTVVCAASLITVSVLLLQPVLEVYIMTDFHVILNEYFNEESREKEEGLNVTIQVGPQKGLITTATKARLYNDILVDISKIKTGAPGPVLITENFSWFYLYLDMPYATYSSWFYTFNIPGFILRLNQYFKLHPDKFPSYIYIPKIMGYSYDFNLERATMMLDKIEKIIIENKYGYIVNESPVGYTVYIEN